MYAYTLLEQPIVVHLNVDSLILRPLDVIYDTMIDGIGTVDPSDLPAAGGNVPPDRPDRHVLHSRPQSHCSSWTLGGGAERIPGCEDGPCRIQGVPPHHPGER